MKLALRITLVLIITSSGAVTDAADENKADQAEEQPALDIDTIFSENAGPDDYRESRNCLRVREYRSVEILDARHLLFIGRNKMWLNELRHRCPSLRPNQILVFERQGVTLCDTNRVSGRDRHLPGIWRGSCLLGRFSVIDEQQALALKDAIAQAGQTRRKKREKKGDES